MALSNNLVRMVLAREQIGNRGGLLHAVRRHAGGLAVYFRCAEADGVRAGALDQSRKGTDSGSTIEKRHRANYPINKG